MHADHIDAAGLRTLIPRLRVESGKNLSLSVGEYANEKPSQMTCRLWLPLPSSAASFCIFRASFTASVSYNWGDVVSYELSIETANSLVGDLLNIPLRKAVPLITLKRQPGGNEFVSLFRYLPFVQNKRR